MASLSVTNPPDDDDSGRGTAIVSDEDAAILKEILEDYDYDVANWAPIRLEADIDVEYASNNTQTQDDMDARAGRPWVNLDQLSQYRNQVENTVRQNKRGVKASPAGDGATDKTATLRANRIREIEYQSHAQEAYSQAFSDCLTRGFGWARIVAEYEDDTTNNQVIRTKSIANPNQLIPDTDAQSTSGRDWSRCVFLDSISHTAFKRDYPDAAIRDFGADTIAAAPKGWLTATRIQIAEAWRVDETPNPKGYGRPHREVCMYLTNGLELLAKKGQPKKHPWKGKYIPFGACLGRVVYKTSATGTSRKEIFSYIRFARDAAKTFNWTWSTILEKLALPVRASLMGYKGQADQDTINAITRATREPVPWIEFAAVMDATGTQVLPLPQYGTREPDVQADLLVAEACQHNIQNALGHFNASDGRLGQTKVVSGVALQEQKRAGDLGSYDFQDHYDHFLEFFGEQYNDLLDNYDDASKEMATRLPDNTVEMVRVNTMTGKDPQGNTIYGPNDARIPFGRHTITIATGPSFDSQREAGKDAAMTLLGNPAAFPVVASDAVKLLDLGPIGDQMSEDLEFLQPPVMQQARQQKKGGGPDPRQTQQELAQTKEQLGHAESIMKAQAGELASHQAEIASKERIADMNTQRAAILAVKLQAMKDASAMAVAKLNLLAKGVVADGERQLEQIALDHEAAITGLQMEHEKEQAALDRTHAAEQATIAQQHQVGMAAAAEGAAAASQAAGHTNTLAVGQQTADLTPAPAPTGA